jgi:LysM repeat protein
MKKQNLVQMSVISLAVLLVLGFMLLPQIAQNPANAQATYQTPTPGADGRIIYTVQEGDNCTRIFLLTGVEINQIISLNNLDAACTIYPGDKLVLGIVEPPQQTETVVPTVDIALTPSPTPSIGYGEICIVLFNDMDGTGMRTENEPYLAGGAVSINNRLGTVSLTGSTIGGDPEVITDLEPLCFEEVPEGAYNITMAIPDGYNPTTMTNYALTVSAGDNITIDFGAQTSSNIPFEDEQAGGGRSVLLGVAGGLILMGGIGLGIYMLKARKTSD